MSIEGNKALVRRFYAELLNMHDLTLIEEFFGPDYVWHVAIPGLAPGLAGLREAFGQIFASFPDWQVTIEDTVAEEDKVVTRFTSTSTHTREYLGAAPTGKRLTTSGIEIQRLAGGKIVETWEEFDRLGTLQQLGLLPLPDQVPA
jgi:steroid delta-isomerase-like uncharacterized protein